LYYLLLSTTNPNHNVDWTHIWVDAICINQRDEREKSHQVRAMDKVYSNAVAVSAWLGLHRAPSWMQWREADVKTLESSNWFLFENVLEIAERAYWSRMWIVQELVLARRIRLHVSDRSFDFNDLAWAAKDMLKSDDAEDLRQLLAYVEARDFDNIDTQKPLHELLLRFKDCRCSDPRDNVFALLSLVNEEDKNILGNCFPDYSLTHDAVVVITLHFLQDHHEQNITCNSHAIFESLGASSSQLMRRRLLAASTTLCAFSNLRGIGEANFREIPFYEWEHPAEAQADRRRWKDSIRPVAVKVWWLVISCGTLWYFGKEWLPLGGDTLASIIIPLRRRL
jgi:hypothetical protein